MKPDLLEKNLKTLISQPKESPILKRDPNYAKNPVFNDNEIISFNEEMKS